MKIKKKIIISILTIINILYLSISLSFAEINFSFNSKSPKLPNFTASKELEKTIINQTVSVLILEVGGCSGTVIYEDDINQYVLTAKHCVEVGEEMYVEYTKVSYIITSASEDLALLVIRGKIPNKKVAIISKWSGFIGDTVHHIAYPRQIIYKASGKVTRNTDDWQWFDFKSIFGCSGGGVFNEDGELIAVLWGGYTNVEDDAPMKTVGEPLYDIKGFLHIVLPEVF